MRSIHTLPGLLAVILCTPSAMSQIPAALELAFNACAMKRAIAQSPDQYFVAVVEKAAQKPCTGTACSDIWIVRKLLASRMPESTPEVPTEFRLPALPGQSDPGKPEGTTAIGIFASFIPGAKDYFGSLISYSVTPEREESYTKAIGLAIDPAAPIDCKRFFPSPLPSNPSLERP
jgi:hypothetical protein